MKQHILSLGAFSILFALALAAAAPASAETFDRFVNPFGTCAAGEPAHTTIQEAIDAAAPGDLIGVCPGTYAEAVTIGTNDLTLRPTGASAVHIVHPDFFPRIGIDIRADGVTVRGFEVSGFSIRATGCGIAVGGIGATVTDNEVHDNEEGICGGGSSAVLMNNVVRRNVLGIFLRHAHDVTVVGNRIVSNFSDGIRDLGSERTVIQQNVLTGNGRGLHSLVSTETHITRNTLRGNQEGMRFEEATDAMVDGNVVTESGGDGVLMVSTSGCTLSLNRVSGNAGFGVAVSSTSSCLFDGNRVTGNDGVGISLTEVGPGNTIARNVASGNGGAVDCFWDGSDAPVFTNNACASEAPPGAWE